MKHFFRKKQNIIAVGIIALVLAGVGIYWYIGTSATPTFSENTVGKGNVIESVDESGNVLAENSAAVSFQEGGQIADVNVSEGSVVSAGTVLADLDAAQLQAAVQQANAALAGAQAQLSQLQSGTRPEQLQIDQSAVTSAHQTLAIAVENAYGASDDAVRNQLDTMFANTQTNNATFLVSNNNSQTVNNIQDQRLQIVLALTQWYAALNATSSDPALLSGTATTVLQQIQSYIDTLALVVNNATPNSSMPAATLAQYKGAIATARAEVQGSISAVSGDGSALTAAQNVLALAQAGATSQQISAQQAVVAQAQAAAANAQVVLDHASLVAPFSGTVQNLTAQVGQVVSPGTPLMSLINNSGLKIEVYVSESDVAKIKTGDAASVTLDALGTGTVLPATVSTIDAAQTQVNGSAAYMVTLHFTNPDSRIKDGMTGNVHIIEAEHDNVVEVPSNLVINDNNDYFVLMQNGTTIEKKPVQIGIMGGDGMTEIVSGLNVGDHINNF
jgi:multidrug efflux pump subunit AcrA (membrane-fusion protein)